MSIIVWLQEVDLRLKWPNDIYYGRQMKLGGIIVKSTIMDGMVHATIGGCLMGL